MALLHGGFENRSNRPSEIVQFKGPVKRRICNPNKWLTHHRGPLQLDNEKWQEIWLIALLTKWWPSRRATLNIRTRNMILMEEWWQWPSGSTWQTALTPWWIFARWICSGQHFQQNYAMLWPSKTNQIKKVYKICRGRAKTQNGLHLWPMKATSNKRNMK